MEIKKYNDFILNEKLGIAEVVYKIAKDIYDKDNLKKYEERKRDHIRDTLVIDTSKLDEPFNKIELKIMFYPTKRPKKIHGGVDRISENEFNLYIYQHCNNIPRTLTHELDHIYQIFLRKKHYNTDKDMPSSLRKSEQSPTLMSIYTQLIQRGVESKEDFIEKLKKLPKYKRYIKIIDNKEASAKDKKIANKMIRKMHKMYALFTKEDK
jgi:hypothetical protein